MGITGYSGLRHCVRGTKSVGYLTGLRFFECNYELFMAVDRRIYGISDYKLRSGQLEANAADCSEFFC